MQFSEMRDRVEALIKLGGWSNASPEPDYPFLVNEGLRIFSRRSCHNVEAFSITTVASQQEYTLDSTTDAPAWISINDDVLLSSTTFIPQTTRDAIRANNRLWRITEAGTITFWYWTRPGTKIGFYPKPSASSLTVTGEGPRHEPLLDADDDVPLLNEDFHEGPCLFAAWHWGKLHARGEERQVVKDYFAEANDIVKECKDSIASQEANCFVRRVSRPEQEYLGIGAMQSPAFWP